MASASHLSLPEFDVADEFVSVLKDLSFVFSGEVVEPRVSKRLENRMGLMFAVAGRAQ